MKTKNSTTRKRIHRCRFFLISALFLLTACASQKTVTAPVQLPPGIEKVLVVSFQTVKVKKGESTGIRCPLSGKIFISGEIAPDARQVMNAQLRNALKGRSGFHFISPERAADIGLPNPEAGGADAERRMLVEAGREVNADAVMAGHIYRFRERVGKKYAVDSPASVAFDIHLVRVSDGRLIWSRHFDETQKALMENLFNIDTFLKRDGQWVTAEQMGVAALEAMLEGLKK